MTKPRYFLVHTMVICSLVAGALGQGVVNSDLQKVANKFIPEGMGSAHKVVQGKFAESASKVTSGNIVALYKNSLGTDEYEGLILIPQGAEAYDQHRLPDPTSTWSMMDPKAVFFANADGDAENELFIIEECYTGIGPTGAQPFYRTRVYDWNGSSFVHLETLSEKIGNLNTAVKVRNKLRQIARTTKLLPTEMFQPVDLKEHNQRIEKASAAGEDWVKQPMQIFARTTSEFSDMRSRTIEMIAPTADGSDSLTVTVTNDGYLDDSVRGEKFRYQLKADDQGVWKFISAGKSWRCWPGRGHQDFSTTQCL